MTDEQMKAVNAQFDEMRQQFGDMREQFNRQGVLLENNTRELRLVAESVHTLQKVMNIKFDDLHERLDQRFVPLELAVKHHTERLNERH